jgi:hypothetical protein
VILDIKLEIPKNIGDNSNTLLANIRSLRYLLSAKPGNNNLVKSGIKKYIIILTAIIRKKKAEKTESINFCPWSLSFLYLSMKNGTSTEADTKDAIDTNIKSGILKAE